MTIDLRSDTVTLPDAEMRRVMASAPMGDDSYGEDPSVSRLESFCAEYFDKEAALLTCSGTMSNQLALRSLTQPGDEVVLDASHHIYYFESAQTADLARVTLSPCATPDGILTAAHLAHALSSKPRSANYSKPVLVCIENTISCHGGRVFPLNVLEELHAFATTRSMATYLDGARLPNACVASKTPAVAYARHVTVLSVCLAKGLGAPFGAILAGPSAVIEKARRYRKWYGGALHQAGAMAAAGLHALETNYARLAEDHHHAGLLATLLRAHPRLKLTPARVETNIVMIDVSATCIDAHAFADAARLAGMLIIPWTPTVVRAVTHAGITERNIRQAAEMFFAVCEPKETNTRARSHLC
jgi:threonine aldolase